MIYQTNLNEFKFDLSNIPFPNNYFDMVISSHVLEHVPNITQCLGELYRVIKPGGVGFLAFPANFHLNVTIEDTGEQLSLAERKAKFGQEDHYRVIGRDILDKLSQSGLKRDEDESRQPKNFYQRRHLAKVLNKYINSEFSVSYDEQIWFIHKPGGSVPRHMQS
jgi:ubiquinone/menaquinone biosynthesis C-methylase UbiE